jgi:broad specificity phosphatase PhoE
MKYGIPWPDAGRGIFVFRGNTMAGKVLLIRHGNTGSQYEGRFLGRTDVPLSPEGRLQSSLLAKPLQKEAAAAYIASPSRRTCETAQAALAWGALAPDLDPDLREIDFGAWEGKTFAEIHAADPEAVAGWAAYKPEFAFPGGEWIADFLKRVRKAGNRIAACPAETVAVFTHAGVIRSLICHYLGLDSRNYLCFDVKPASLTTIMLFDGKGVLTGLNDLCHIESGASWID